LTFDLTIKKMHKILEYANDDLEASNVEDEKRALVKKKQF